MKWLQDFHVGYSPERVNPGDKERTITKIVKVVSGDDAATLDKWRRCTFHHHRRRAPRQFDQGGGSAR